MKETARTRKLFAPVKVPCHTLELQLKCTLSSPLLGVDLCLFMQSDNSDIESCIASHVKEILGITGKRKFLAGFTSEIVVEKNCPTPAPPPRKSIYGI